MEKETLKGFVENEQEPEQEVQELQQEQKPKKRAKKYKKAIANPVRLRGFGVNFKCPEEFTLTKAQQEDENFMNALNNALANGAINEA